MDDFEEIFNAAKPFEEQLSQYIADYLAQYPTTDQLFARYDAGEVIRIDFKSLAVDTLMAEDLPLSEDEREDFVHNWSCPDFYFSDFFRLTRPKEGFREVNEAEVKDVACHALWKHLHGRSASIPL